MKKPKSHYCRDCQCRFNAPEILEKRTAYKCPQCRSENWALVPGKAPCMYGDRHDFGRETCPYTGKNGRYFPQLARYPDDPTAVVRDVKEAVEIGKRRGLKAEKMA